MILCQEANLNSSLPICNQCKINSSKMNNMLVTAEACFILFFVESFQDVNFLLQFRWFFSNLWKPISCGRFPAPGSGNDWVVTKIVDSDNQSITLRDIQKKQKRHHTRKRKPLILLPTSSVLFTYSSYRVAICLEISPSMFSVRPNGQTPLDEMSQSLQSVLVHIHQSLLSQHNISQVYVSILGHHAHYTHCLYQGLVTKSTTISEVVDKIKPIFTKIEQIISARYEQAMQKSALLEALFAASQRENDFYSSEGGVGVIGGGKSPSTTATTPYDQGDSEKGDGEAFFTTTSGATASTLSASSASPDADYMSLESVCEGLNFHLNLLPEKACPVAILITSGVLSLSSLSQTSQNLSSANISLHVLVVSLPLASSLGCVQDIESLRLLAESSGGSLEMISVKADNSINMDSFGHIFLRPFCTHKNIDGREEDGSSAHHGSWSPSVSGQTTSSTARSSSLALASERASGLKMQEARLQGYQLEGATLEHLVAARCGEGFSIMSISEDKGSSRGLGMRGSTGSFPSSVSASSIMITIRLEKHISKVSTLIYEISFRSSSEIHGSRAGVASRGSGILSCPIPPTKCYTTATFSIDITNVCLTPRSAKFIHPNPDSNSRPHNDARDIFESDKRVAYFLGQSGMPGKGCIPLPARKTESALPVPVPQLEKMSSNMSEETGDTLYLQNQQGNSAFHWSRHHAKLLNHLAAIADLVEEVCRLDTMVEVHVYLRALILLINITGSVRCRDRIFSSIKKILPKAHFHSLGFLRWLCISPTIVSSHENPIDRLEAVPSLFSQQEINFTYDVMIIDIRQIASVFLEIKITGLGNLTSRLDEKTNHFSSDTSSSSPCEVNLNDIIQCIMKALKSLDFDPVKLHRDLSSIAIIPTTVMSRSPYKRRQGLLTSCYLESVCHFTEISLTSRSLVESLVSDLCRSKIAVGFQVMSCITTETSVELCLCAIIPSCPSGIETTSLIQCMIESSDEGILTTYFWEPSSGVAVCNQVGLCQQSFELSLGRFMSNCKSKHLMEYVKSLVKQDSDMHNFYTAVSSIYTFGCTKKMANFSPTSHFSSCGHNNLPGLMISLQNWMRLCTYSTLFVSELNAFSEKFYDVHSCSGDTDKSINFVMANSPREKKSEEDCTSDASDNFVVIDELKKLLFLSMVEYVGLSRVEVTNDTSSATSATNFDSIVPAYTCCFPMRDGVFMIEMKSAVEFDVDELTEKNDVNNSSCENADNADDVDDVNDEGDTFSEQPPHVVAAKHTAEWISRDGDHAQGADHMDHDFGIMSPNSLLDDYDGHLIDAAESSLSHTPRQRLDSRDSTTPLLRAKDISRKLEEVADYLDDSNYATNISTSGKILLECRFLPVPVNTLFANEDMISLSKECVLATSAASSASRASKTAFTSNPTSTSSSSRSDSLSMISTTTSVPTATSSASNEGVPVGLSTSSNLAGLPLAMRKQLKKLLDDIDVYSRSCFVLVLYTGLRNKSIRRIHPVDLSAALDVCTKQYLEVDVTTVCRLKRLAMFGLSFGESSPDGNVAAISSPKLFRATIGKLLTAIVNSDCFMFSSNSSTFGIPMVDSIYRIALFVKIALVRKSVVNTETAATPGPPSTMASSSTDDDEQREEVISVTATDDGLCQSLLGVCRSLPTLGSAMSKHDADVSEETVMLRLECLSASATDMTEDLTTLVDSLGAGDMLMSPTTERGTGGVPSLGSLQSAYRASLLRQLTHEMQSYVTFDTLQCLLLVPTVNAETILLVQHSLRETKNVINTSHLVDFLTPPNRNVNSFMDFVTSMLEDEMLQQMSLKKIGGIFYARGYSVPVLSDACPGEASSDENVKNAVAAKREGESSAEAETETETDTWIPCWVLLTTSQCTPVAADVTAPTDDGGGGIVEDMSITSIEVLITLRTIGDYELEQTVILKMLCEAIDKCACRVNQFILLKEMHETRAASSYLIADCSSTANNKTKKKTGILSSSRKDNRRYSGGQRVYDSPVDVAVVIPTFKFPGYVPKLEVKTDALLSQGGNSDVVEETAEDTSAESETPVDTPPVLTPIPPTRIGLSLSWRNFAPGHFACPRQGSIDCFLPQNHASALYHDLAMRRLEDSALHPFTISNLRSCFVYQNRHGHLYYMAFEPSDDKEERKISLVVFGIFPIEDAMVKHLTDLLETKIIEQMAKVISIMCLRQKKLQMGDIHFVKNSGTSRHVNMSYDMPAFVSDHYYFFTIVRQVFNVSNVFFGNDVLDIVQNESSVKLVELCHPASFGYVTSAPKYKSKFQNIRKRNCKDEFFCSSSSDESEIESSTAEEQEDQEEKNYDDEDREFVRLSPRSRMSCFQVPVKNKSAVLTEESISPVFFPKFMRKQCPRSKEVCSGSSILWKQKDFTFLYNYQPSAGEKSITSVLQSRIGQGLTLIEFEPMMFNKKDSSSTKVVCDVPISSLKHGEVFCATGTLHSLLSDAEKIVRYMKCSADGIAPTLPTLVASSGERKGPVKGGRRRRTNILGTSSKSNGAMGDGGGISLDSNSNSNTSSTSSFPSPSSFTPSVEDPPVFALNLRIYPTFPMNTSALVDHCTNCFNQALEIYCMERLISAYRRHASPVQKATAAETSPPPEDDIDSLINSFYNDVSDDAHDDDFGNVSTAVEVESFENVSITKFLTTKDLFETSHRILSSISRSHASSGALTKSGLIDIPFAFPKNAAVLLHTTILRTIYASHPHLESTAVSPVNVMAASSSSANTEVSEEAPQGGKRRRIEWLDRVNVSQLGPVQNSCSCLLGDNFVPQEEPSVDTVSVLTGRAESYTTLTDMGSSVTSTENQALDSSEHSYSQSAQTDLTHPGREKATVNTELRRFTDFKPSSCGVTCGIFPTWFHKRHYSIEITITPSGVRVAYFNIIKSEMKNILGIVSLHGQDAIRRMQAAQKLSLDSLGILGVVNFGHEVEECTENQSPVKPGQSSTASGIVDILNLSKMLDKNFLRNSQPVPTSDLSPLALNDLQAQICGLFWSYRVLSRLHSFDDVHTQNIVAGVHVTHPVIEDLFLVPKYLWGTLGLPIADFCLPVTSVAISDRYISPMFSGLMRSPSFFSPTLVQEDEISNQSPVLLDSHDILEGEEAYFLCLRHLLKSHECILSTPTLLTVGPSQRESTADHSYADSNSFVILPIPRTSSLCVFELNRQHVPGHGDGACNWLIVSQRAMDVSDVVNKLGSYYNIHPLQRLLSPVTEACLQQPSLRTCMRGELSNQPDRQYPIDPYGGASINFPPFCDTDSVGWGDSRAQPPPVLGTILDHPSVKKVSMDIYFAAMSSFFFFPPRIQTSAPHKPLMSSSGFPIARSSKRVTPCVVHDSDDQSLRALGGELADHIICSEEILSPFAVPGEASQSPAVDGIRPPMAVDVIESYLFSCAHAAGKSSNAYDLSGYNEDRVLCFRFIMNKKDRDAPNDVLNQASSDLSEGDIFTKARHGEEYGFFTDNIVGVCLLRCNNDSTGGARSVDSFSLFSCIFEGSQVSGEDKHIAGNQILTRQMNALKDSGDLISICPGSEREMLLEMKQCVLTFCCDMVKVFYNNSGWKQLFESSQEKAMMTTVNLENGGLPPPSSMLPPDFTNSSTVSLCMGGHQVYLPLATVFVFSFSQRLAFLDFLLPSLAMFRTVQNATFLYNLFLKAFQHRVFFIVPDVSNNFASVVNGKRNSFHFLITGECSRDPFFLHIEIEMEGQGEAYFGAGADVGGEGMQVSLVEANASLLEGMGDDAFQTLGSLGDNGGLHFNPNSHMGREGKHSLSRDIVVANSEGAECGAELRRSNASFLIENVVNIVLYAANILLSQQ